MGQVHAPHRSPTAPKDRDWDWSGTNKLDEILDHGGWDAVANAHAWWDANADDNDPPQQKGAYKLPHHELIGGRLKVVWRGVVAAMTVVNGARGGVDIPDADRQQVYDHLADHYAEFDEQPPDYSG
jgi:plasmid stabilization system protein ParE